MTDKRLTRRRMIQATTGLAVAGLAGCAGTQTNSVPGSSGSSGGTQTAEQHTEGAESSHDDGESSHSEGEETHSESEEGSHSDDGHGHGEAVGAPSDTAEVAMVTQEGGYHFEPHVVRVNVGGTVRWVNESGSHSTTLYHADNDQPQLAPEGAAAWDSGVLTEQGATFEHTFETEGVYHYYCTPHESLGMIGSVIVGEPDAHGQPALEDPPTDKPEKVRKKLTELNEMVNEALGHEH